MHQRWAHVCTFIEGTRDLLVKHGSSYVEGKRYQLSPKSSCTGRQWKSWFLSWTATKSWNSCVLLSCEVIWAKSESWFTREAGQMQFSWILMFGGQEEGLLDGGVFSVAVYLRLCWMLPAPAAQAGWTHGLDGASLQGLGRQQLEMTASSWERKVAKCLRRPSVSRE